MKKILFIFMAAFTMLFTACQSCGTQPEPEQKDDAVVIASDNWDDLIEKSLIAIHANYPEYEFYEASGNVKKIDKDGITWGVDRNTFQIVFGKINGNATVIGTVKNDTLNLFQVDEPWLEDVHMTPYVPVDLNSAIEVIQKNADFEPEGCIMVLRYQLWPGEAEPRWFAGSAFDCLTVGANTMKFNEPLSDTKNRWVEHTGFAAQKK